MAGGMAVVAAPASAAATRPGSRWDSGAVGTAVRRRRAGATAIRWVGGAAACRQACTRSITPTRTAAIRTATAVRQAMTGVTGTITAAPGATTALRPQIASQPVEEPGPVPGSLFQRRLPRQASLPHYPGFLRRHRRAQ